MAQEVAEREKKEVVPVQKREVGRRGEFERMFDQVDQMMSEWWSRPFSGLMPSFPSQLRPSRALMGEPLRVRISAVDVFEEPEEVIMKAEIPGLAKEDLKIDLSDSILTISGEKKKEEDVKEEDYTYSERSYGTFSRSLQLPCAVKADKVKATFKNGVLEVKLPKTDEAKKRRVTVNIE
ncbi:MAG: Hsp20/alpha crystallin family protein [Nitrospirales bacterium]